ncbi:MAG: ATP-binding protein, partial [Bacteroidales bacterium]|nr:ATP-binding protein [Bacteroidales bacterium]
MTKEELLQRLSDIEWDDFEVKEASGGLPKSIWETVSAFSNTSGGWIILGVKEKRDENGSTYIVTGVPNVEKMEQEIISTLRSRTKFNSLISGKAKLYDIDGKKVLAFEIPLSPHRP